MQRRTYLALSAGVAGAAAGCMSASGETSLLPNEDIDDSGGTLRFSEDGEDVFTVRLQHQFTDPDEHEYYPFRVSTWQADDLTLDSWRLQFRSPPQASAYSRAGIYLREDAHAHLATLSQDGEDPSITVLDLPETSSIGEGTVTVRLLLAADPSQDPHELWMHVEAVLEGNGLLDGSYTADGHITIPFT